MKPLLTIAAMLTLGGAASMPLPSLAQAQLGFSVTIQSAPPAPRFEHAPAARRGYVWAPGYWNWDGARHRWLDGHWESARDGYQYQRGQWQRDGNGYRLREGGWQPVAQSGYAPILIAPPAPRYEPVPYARDGYIWQPGRWDWHADRYQWRQGSWIVGRSYDDARPNWVRRDERWSVEPPRWDARGRDRDRDHDGIPDRMERGRDRDHDGIPDRFERKGWRDQDRDGVANRRDNDRDGDGVRNDRDARPDNRRRY